MLFLSDAAIRYAVEMCRDNDNYSVCVCTSSRPAFDYACDSVYEALDSSDIDNYRRNRHGYYLYMRNGSIIRVFTSNEKSNGTDYHLVIADKRVDRQFLERVLLPHEKLEWIDFCNRNSSNKNNDED